jgi:hypothetical protein
MPPSNSEEDSQNESVPNNSGLSPGLSSDDDPLDILRNLMPSFSDLDSSPWSSFNLRVQSPHSDQATDQTLHQDNHTESSQYVPYAFNTHIQLSDEYPATSVSEATNQFPPIAPRSYPYVPPYLTPDPWTGRAIPPTGPLEDPSEDGTSCDQCNIKFRGEYRRGNRSRHIRSQHENQRVRCRTLSCNKAFKRSDA